MNKFSKIITLVLSLLLLSSLPSKAWVMDVWELRGVTADEVSEATIAFKEKAMAGGAKYTAFRSSTKIRGTLCPPVPMLAVNVGHKLL